MILKYKKAFTLIELLVVSVIIIVMAGISVPSLSKFGKKGDFQQKVDEAKQVIEEARVSAKNPEKDYDRYEVVVNSTDNTLAFYKAKLSELASKIEVRKVVLPRNSQLEINSEDTPYINKTIYACDSPGEVCCLYTSSEEATKCESGNIPNDDNAWLGIKNDKLGVSYKYLLFKNYLPYVQ